MNKSSLYLFGSILSLIVFIGYMGESSPKTLLGFEINIWVMRAVWLGMTIIHFNFYRKYKKANLNK